MILRWLFFAITCTIILSGCGGLDYISLENMESSWQEITQDSVEIDLSNNVNIKPTTKENNTEDLNKNVENHSIRTHSRSIIDNNTVDVSHKNNSSKAEPQKIDAKKLQKHTTLLAGDAIHFEIIGGEVWVFPGIKAGVNAVGKLFNNPDVTASVPISHQNISIPARDRKNELAISLGFTYSFPDIAETSLTPYGAFYIRQQSQDDLRRFRGIITGFVNYLDFADGTWNNHDLELILHWENMIIPFPQTEIVNGQRAEFLEIERNSIWGGVGIGWRQPIKNFWSEKYSQRNDFDNDARVQLLYEPGYIYMKRADETSKDTILPPDTAIHQLHLKARLDTFTRNLLELPHSGLASGLDVWLGHKVNWKNHQFGGNFRFLEKDTRDYLKISAYIAAAFGIPWMSEQNRIIISSHWGWSPANNWDRFTALRFGGGPAVSESHDLERPVFMGAAFNHFVAQTYSLTSLEYRYELFDFFYIHTKGAFLWGKFGMLESNRKKLEDSAFVFSVAVTTGFIWKSLIYAEYSLDDGFLRRGKPGYAMLLIWSKEI